MMYSVCLCDPQAIVPICIVFYFTVSCQKSNKMHTIILAIQPDACTWWAEKPSACFREY